MTITEAAAYRAAGAEQREKARLLAHARAASLAAARRDVRVGEAVQSGSQGPTAFARGRLVDVKI